MEETKISKPILISEKFAQVNSFQSFHHEEKFLHLKSRSLWLQAGDKNSAFFHKHCRARLSRNHISELYYMDGEVIKGHTLLKLVAKLHFQNLFREDEFSDEKVNVDCLSYIPSLVGSKINVGLGRPFS